MYIVIKMRARRKSTVNFDQLEQHYGPFISRGRAIDWADKERWSPGETYRIELLYDGMREPTKEEIAQASSLGG